MLAGAFLEHAPAPLLLFPDANPCALRRGQKVPSSVNGSLTQRFGVRITLIKERIGEEKAKAQR